MAARVIEGEVTNYNSSKEHNLQLAIDVGDGKLQYPTVLDNITWEIERKGAPSKLTFTVVKDEKSNFVEGATVHLSVDGTIVFVGYVFSKSRNKDQHIKVTAYDQLRYFKSKDTYIYDKKGETATEVLNYFIGAYRLKAGTIEDTGYRIPVRDEEDSIFDIVLNALDLTLINTGKLYILYDDAGTICLKEASKMVLDDFIIDETSAEDFDYESTIDKDVYTQIKVAFDNKNTGAREIYMIRNETNANTWGLLQYYHKVDDRNNAINIANTLSKVYAQKRRTLKISGVIGDLRVRAGCSIGVRLNLGDIITNKLFFVERVVHHFEHDRHYMDLDFYDSGVWRIDDSTTGTWQEVENG